MFHRLLGQMFRREQSGRGAALKRDRRTINATLRLLANLGDAIPPDPLARTIDFLLAAASNAALSCIDTHQFAAHEHQLISYRKKAGRGFAGLRRSGP